MKTTQFFIAVLFATVLLFAWSYAFWAVANPVASAFIDAPTTELSAFLPQTSSTSKGNVNAYTLTDPERPEWIGRLFIVPVVDPQNITLLAKNALTCFLIAITAATLIMTVNLHLGTFLQRFALMLGAGAIQSLQLVQTAIVWPDTPWHILVRVMVYQWMFWVILGLIMAWKMGIRKRNLFL